MVYSSGQSYKCSTIVNYDVCSVQFSSHYYTSVVIYYRRTFKRLAIELQPGTRWLLDCRLFRLARHPLGLNQGLSLEIQSPAPQRTWPGCLVGIRLKNKNESRLKERNVKHNFKSDFKQVPTLDSTIAVMIGNWFSAMATY